MVDVELALRNAWLEFLARPRLVVLPLVSRVDELFWVAYAKLYGEYRVPC